MKFKRRPRYGPFIDTSRKRAAALRNQKRERDKLRLFAGAIALTQPSIDDVMLGRALPCGGTSRSTVTAAPYGGPLGTLAPMPSSIAKYRLPSSGRALRAWAETRAVLSFGAHSDSYGLAKFREIAARRRVGIHGRVHPETRIWKDAFANALGRLVHEVHAAFLDERPMAKDDPRRQRSPENAPKNQTKFLNEIISVTLFPGFVKQS